MRTRTPSSFHSLPSFHSPTCPSANTSCSIQTEGSVTESRVIHKPGKERECTGLESRRAGALGLPSLPRLVLSLFPRAVWAPPPHTEAGRPLPAPRQPRASASHSLCSGQAHGQHCGLHFSGCGGQSVLPVQGCRPPPALPCACSPGHLIPAACDTGDGPAAVGAAAARREGRWQGHQSVAVWVQSPGLGPG